MMACTEELVIARLERRVHEAALFVHGRPLPDGYVWCAKCGRLLNVEDWLEECRG
jgi:hypothetical protein